MNEDKGYNLDLMYGHWLFSTEEFSIHLDINNSSHVIKISNDGEKSEVSARGHYFGFHYCLDDRYFIFYVDENELIFGRHASDVIGDYEWRYNFIRIK